MSSYDVVIIGSGLGGLECGYILSSEGYNVCIVEQHSQIGGCLQNFKRDNCVFDTGIHYIGGLDKGQILNQYFTYFGLMDKLRLQRMDQEAFDVIGFANDPMEYHLAMGHENFIRRLMEYFPDEKDALVHYIRKLNEICEHFPLYNLSYKNLHLNELQFFRENAYDYFTSITDNKKLQRVLAGTNSLYAGVPEKTPLYVHALVNNSFIESSWKVVDGSSQIADILAAKIILNGGKIITSARAEKFVFNNNRLTSVALANDEVIDARYFISAIHPAQTIGMVDEKFLRSVYRQRIKTLENTTSNFTLYIVFKPDSFEYLNHNLYFYRNENVWLSNEKADQNWPGNILLITPASSSGSKYACNATVMSYMNIDDVKKWENTVVGKRSNDYLDFKQQKAGQMLDLVELRYPGFRKCIHKYYTSSPLTYRDYTGTVDGSLYGVLRDCNDPLKTLISPRTKIPNLFLTGQNIILHGVLGVTIGSVTTCSELLGLEYLVGKIKSCNP
ncbi:MAG TPA: NAD(P)/FAD-dependent oxidoreductase [Bacteroidales bacterium]|nr:NAD(P)/FAD-dependent oxidoreductase [Bacteroidales bacterium]